MRLVGACCGRCGDWSELEHTDDAVGLPDGCLGCGVEFGARAPVALVYETVIKIGPARETVSVAQFGGLWDVARREALRREIEGDRG